MNRAWNETATDAAASTVGPPTGDALGVPIFSIAFVVVSAEAAEETAARTR